MDITVYDGEYEYLIETDPRFREFVKSCEGKTIELILSEVVTNFVTSNSIKGALNVQNTFDT